MNLKIKKLELLLESILYEYFLRPNTSFYILYEIKDDRKVYIDYRTNVDSSIDNFQYKKVTCLQFIWILICLINKEKSLETKVVIYHMCLNKITAYKLAQLLNISKQMISQCLNGSRKFSQTRLEEIAVILNFSLDEYKKIEADYVIDEE